jgi:hypothetical protein
VSAKAIEIITEALQTLNLISGSEIPSAEDAAIGLKKLNSILDEASARKMFAFNMGFAQYTLIPNHQPHTIGPTGDFAATQRPVTIESASIVLAGANPIDIPLKLEDDAWWASQAVKSLTSTIPTHLYYSADIVNGSLYLWPVPTIAYGLRLETWVQFAQFADLNTTAYQFAPGYQRWLMLALAIDLAPLFGTEAMARAAGLQPLFNSARRAVQMNNNAAPRIATADSGMPNKKRKGGFNYYTGGPA